MKIRGTKRHFVPESNTSLFTNTQQIHAEIFRISRNIRMGCFVYTSAAGTQGCSWSVRDLQEKPRGGSRGAVTRILSGR
jgi:hypothetical protein